MTENIQIEKQAEGLVEVQAEVNLFQAGGITYASLQIPGFGKDDIDAFIQNDALIIEGNRDTIYEMNEIHSYRTEFILPAAFRNEIKIDRATEVCCVKVENGICLVTFNKIEPAKTNIEVE